MNFNEEFAQLSLGSKLVEISEEDKATISDYQDLERKALEIDQRNSSMIRESERNAQFGLPCGSTLVEKAVELRQILFHNFYGIEELQRLFLKTSVSDYFTHDNVNQCDTDSIPLVKRKYKRTYQKRR